MSLLRSYILWLPSSSLWEKQIMNQTKTVSIRVLCFHTYLGELTGPQPISETRRMLFLREANYAANKNNLIWYLKKEQRRCQTTSGTCLKTVKLHMGITLPKSVYSLKRHCEYLFPAAAAKSLQSCPTLCDPIDGSPPGSPIPGILQARTLEWVAISFSNAWKWSCSVVSNS